jgi:hypothetical protein
MDSRRAMAPGSVEGLQMVVPDGNGWAVQQLPARD